MKLAIIASTRPDFIRLARLIKLAKNNPAINCVFIATGQHYDDTLFGQFLTELNIPRPDYILNLQQDTVIKQIASLLTQLEEVLIKEQPDVALFLGDVNGVLGSISCLKLDIPVVHVEAGGRSFAFQMPEERNRILIDRISNRLYCYHADYKINLVREGANPSNIVVVGNIIHDALNDYAAEIESRQLLVREKYKLPQRFFLMTMHRAENLNDLTHAWHILTDVNHLAKLHGVKVILPVMPRLKELVDTHGGDLDNFLLQDPLGFLDFVALEKEASLVITDSGTCQEECAIFGVPAIIIREMTERPFCLSDINRLAMDRFDKVYEEMLLAPRDKMSLGDGKTSERILKDLLLNWQKLKYSHDMVCDKYVMSHHI